MKIEQNMKKMNVFFKDNNMISMKIKNCEKNIF